MGIQSDFPRSAPEQLLKQGPNRSVLLVVEDGEQRIVKRFHAHEPWRRLFDGRRARRERRALDQARAAALPVPEVLGLRRSDAGWELVTEFLPEAANLHGLLRGREPWPAPRGRVARALGELLARCATVGLLHPDPHPGNVLVGRDGRVWLVDLAGARVTGRPWSRRRFERSLIEIVADLREGAPCGDLARALVSLGRSVPDRRRRGGDSSAPTDWARRIAARARTRRQELVRGGLERWERASGIMEVEEDQDGTYWRRRLDLGPGAQEALAAPAPELRDGGAGTPSERAAWRACAQLWEHELPVAVPWEREVGSARARFHLPRGAQPLAAFLERAETSERRRLARELGILVATLHDRGFACAV